jgi:hypothetical protein
MVLTFWNRETAALLVVGAVGLTVTLNNRLGHAQAQAGRTTTLAKQESPKAPSQPQVDDVRRAKDAVQAAEAQLQAARKKYEAIKGVRERAEEAKIATSQAALRRQIQAMPWLLHPEQSRDGRTLKLLSYDPSNPLSGLASIFAAMALESGLTLELPVAENVRVQRDGQEVKWPIDGLDFVSRWASVSGQFREDRPEVTAMVLTSTPPPGPVLQAVHAAKKSVSLVAGGKVTLVDLPLVGDAEIKGVNDASIGLGDLMSGMRVGVHLVVAHGTVVVARIRKTQ